MTQQLVKRSRRGPTEMTVGRRLFSPTLILAAVLVVGLAACTSDGSTQDDATVDDSSVADGAGGENAAGGAAEPQSALAAAIGPILRETGDGLSGPELEQYLARRYEAYWFAFDQARAAPSGNGQSDYPELSNLAAGDLLETSYQELAELFDAGEAIREPEVAAVAGLDANSSHRIRVESLEVGVAELVSCLVNDNVRYVVDGGEVLSDGVLTVQARSTLARADGTWKVIRSEAQSLEPGVAGCWLEDEGTYPL